MRVPPLPPLCAILDVETVARLGRDPLDIARAFLAGGARFLQIRAKDTPSGPFLVLARAVVDAARPAGALVIVNDRADIAALAGAAGVHVGQEDLSVADTRRVVGDAAIVGVSTHTPDQMAAALACPLSYMAIGPVFGTATKATGYDAVGLSMVRTASGTAGEVPVVAIGGITLANAAAVLEAGASSVAVISDLCAAPDPAARVAQYVRELSAHRV